jgi:hypothetical protein
MVLILSVIMIVMIVVTKTLPAVKYALLIVMFVISTILWRLNGLIGPLNNLVEFAAVKPDTPTFRAVIYFDTLTLCNLQIRGRTNRTLHNLLLLFLRFDGLTLTLSSGHEYSIPVNNQMI